MQIKNILNITDKKDLKTDNPHIRQNTDLFVKWCYQIQGGQFSCSVRKLERIILHVELAV